MTSATRHVLRTFVEEPARELYGTRLSRLTGVGASTVYAMLSRLERADRLRSRYERPDEVDEARRQAEGRGGGATTG